MVNFTLGIPKPHFARRTAANLVSPRAKVRPASQDEQAESASKVNTWIEASQQYFPQDSDEEVVCHFLSSHNSYASFMRRIIFILKIRRFIKRYV